MQVFQITKIGLVALALSVSPWATTLGAQTTQTTTKTDKDTTTKTDNTAVNKRDRKPGAVTADQQKENAPDRKITAKIRRSIMADKTLSTYAQNVKIITQDGTVTLKGPVRSDEEAKTIVAKATEIAGDSMKVVNEMSVSPSSRR